MRKPNKSRVIWVFWGLVGLLGPQLLVGALDHTKQVREELITVLSGENVTIKCTGAGLAIKAILLCLIFVKKNL